MRKSVAIVTAISLFVMLSGCAAVFTGGKEDVFATSRPRGAEVFVDGVSYGKTPVILKLKTKTEHEIVFKKKGYKDVKKRLTNKIGAGWIILDVICGLVPVIVDAATGSWYMFDQDTINAQLKKQQPRP